jgi:hypothetical protein
VPFEDQIVEVIRAAMPNGSDIRVVPSVEAVEVCVSWKLNDDPERPNKMSKTIRITVSREAADDFASASGASREEAFRRVSGYLAQRLREFDPKHNVPRDEPPPVEQWVITTNLLNG